MNENVTQSIEERPELGLDFRGLWCEVINNAIEDAQTEYDSEELEVLALMGPLERTKHRKESRYKKLCNIRLNKGMAIKFLRSGELDCICDTFLTDMSVNKIREGVGI